MKNADTIAITKAAIDASGGSTRAFAKMHGLSERTIYNWKSGLKRPSGLSIAMLERLATLTATGGIA